MLTSLPVLRDEKHGALLLLMLLFYRISCATSTIVCHLGFLVGLYYVTRCSLRTPWVVSSLGGGSFVGLVGLKVDINRNRMLADENIPNLETIVQTATSKTVLQHQTILEFELAARK